MHSAHPVRFAHHSLDAFHVALEALRLGHELVAAWPRGHGVLADQLRRALLGAYLQLTEAAARSGADRTHRFRIARAEANEAAGAAEAAAVLGLSSAADVERLLGLLGRLCAMLTRLGGFGTKR
jgi:four helix bundle protein